MKKVQKRDTILLAARSLFAEKGYDATGMEEIAARAVVPKSLIYYHFKGKEQVLTTIVTDFIKEYNQLLHDGTGKGIEKISEYVDFLESNKDCTKIILTESLKNTKQSMLIFEAVIPLTGLSMETLDGSEQSMGAHFTPEEKTHLAAEFFTSIIPALMLVSYTENWCKFFDMDPETLRRDFYHIYKLTHGAYHEHMHLESL